MALSLTLLCLVALKAVHPPEARYQGKPESAWVSSLTNSFSFEADAGEWEALGTDAVPLLCKVISKEESTAHAAYCKLWPKLPRFLQSCCPRPLVRQSSRVNALNILNELAKISPGSSVPVKPILKALRDKNPYIRMSAVICLTDFARSGRLIEVKEEVAHELIRTLQDSTDPAVRNDTIVALEYFGDQAEIVIPVLRAALQDPTSYVRTNAATALEGIEAYAKADTTAYAHVLTNAFETMMTLQEHADDLSHMRQAMMVAMHVALDQLSYLDAHSHPTPELKQAEIKLARDVLDCMLAHRDFDTSLPTAPAGMRALRKILTEPEDVRRLVKLGTMKP